MVLMYDTNGRPECVYSSSWLENQQWKLKPEISDCVEMLLFMLMYQVLHLKTQTLKSTQNVICHCETLVPKCKEESRKTSVLDTSRLLSIWHLTQCRIRAGSGPDYEECSTVPHLESSFREVDQKGAIQLAIIQIYKKYRISRNVM